MLSENPNAIHLVKPTSFIDWWKLSKNPAIFEIDYYYLKKRMDVIREDLCKFVFHPKNEGRLWSIEDDY